MNNFKWLIRNYSVDEIQNISCNLGVKDYVAKLLNINGSYKIKDGLSNRGRQHKIWATLY